MYNFFIYSLEKSFKNFEIIIKDTDEKDADSSPVDTPSRTADKGWSLWGLVRAGWNAKEGSSPTPENPIILPEQGNYYYI